MTGVELIVAALAAGAAAGVTNTATAVVQDTYAGLKSLLRGWLTGRKQAIAALETEETEPGVWQTKLAEDLTASGADEDDAVLAVARRLLKLTEGAPASKYQIDLREAKGVQVGDHNTQTNTFS